MPIRPYLKEGSFDPREVECMSIALEDVCRVLKLPPSAKVAKQAIAERIIELAKSGTVDPNTLRDRVLREAAEGGT